MNYEDFKREMDAYHRDVDREADSLKDPYVRLDRLRTLYNRFDEHERAMANSVLAEWALSDNEMMRFDALVLIDELKLTIAVPALRELSLQCKASDAPNASHYSQWAERIIAKLIQNDRAETQRT